MTGPTDMKQGRFLLRGCARGGRGNNVTEKVQTAEIYPSRSSGKHPNLSGSDSFIVFVMLSCKNGIGMTLDSAGVSSFFGNGVLYKNKLLLDSVCVLIRSQHSEISFQRERRSAGILKTGSRLVGWTSAQLRPRAPSHVLKKRPAKVSFAAAE